MIHTAEFWMKLDYEHLNYRKGHYGKETVNQILHRHMIKGINSVEYSNNLNVSCKMVVDIPLILNKGNIEERDYNQVERYIKGALNLVYGDKQVFDLHYLNRVDYRFDIKVSNEKVRAIYFELFKKLKVKTAHLKKKNYLTSQYHQCDSLHIIIYDKEKECRDKNKPIEIWEKGVVRFEVCVKNDHLKYKKYKKGEPRSLKNYFKKEKYTEYMKKYMLNVCPTGDFYSYSTLEPMIAALDLSTRKKLELKEFVKFVSRGNLDTAVGNYSASTYKKYLKLFNEHGINPIAIPPKYKLDYLESLVKQAVL